MGFDALGYTKRVMVLMITKKRLIEILVLLKNFKSFLTPHLNRYKKIAVTIRTTSVTGK